MNTKVLKSYSKDLHMTDDEFINYLSKRVKTCITKLIPIKNGIKEQMDKTNKKSINSLTLGLLGNKYLIKITNIIKNYHLSEPIIDLTNYQVYLGDAYYFAHFDSNTQKVTGNGNSMPIGNLMPIDMTLDWDLSQKARQKVNLMVKQGFKFDNELHDKQDNIFNVEYPTLSDALSVANYFIGNYRDFIKNINK